MANQDKETVRQILEALLRRLEAEPYKPGEAGTPVLFSDGVSPSAPVIVVIGGLNSSERDYGPGQRDVSEIKPSATKSSASRERPSSHPGLERFPMAETESNSAAPKACFIEPGRACVSSGACEMRGY